MAEVTVASLGVGYEIGRAIEMGKPVLCLNSKNSTNPLSAMVAGSEGVRMHYYDDPVELSDVFRDFIGTFI